MQVRVISPAVEKVSPLFQVDAGLAVKTVASFALASVGIFYLGLGKKNGDLQKLLLGAALVLAGTFVFF